MVSVRQTTHGKIDGHRRSARKNLNEMDYAPQCLRPNYCRHDERSDMTVEAHRKRLRAAAQCVRDEKGDKKFSPLNGRAAR
jgi:hypothetical protein